MKAILVIDIPKEIENKGPYFVQGSLFCYVKTNYGKYRYICDLDKTKLKPMPQKEIVRGFDRYEEGRNDCIDELLEDEQ